MNETPASKPSENLGAPALRCGEFVRPSEGLHQMEAAGERFVVDVRDTMQGQYPCTAEVRMAFFLSGPPRFPWSVRELLDMGATFKALGPNAPVRHEPKNGESKP